MVAATEYRTQAIDLQLRVADAVDRRDWTTFANCFADGATADLPHSGHHDSVALMILAIKPIIERLEATQHHLSNHIITVDGDGGVVECYLISQAVRLLETGPTLFTFGGRYIDRVVREAGVLKIAHRREEVVWRSGDPGVLRAAGGV